MQTAPAPARRADAPQGMVFRDATSACTLPELAVRALAALAPWRDADPRPADAFADLLRVADLECALCDADLDAEAQAAAELADAIAEVVLDAGKAGRAGPVIGRAAAQLAGRRLPDRPCVSRRCEGFAYYALRPDMVARGLPAGEGADAIVIVGVRTIGTPLGALAAAAFRAESPRPVTRLTLRPQGHPYDRRVTITTACDRRAERVVRAHVGRRTLFVVIDEGPGLSGSSLLSVAEWLESCGAEQGRIVMYASHSPDPRSLCARDAARRWPRYRCLTFAAPPPDPATDLSGGRWRALLGHDVRDWPPVWALTEREKRLLREGSETSIEKFEGLGPYGQSCVARARAVAEGGFGPHPRRADPARGTLIMPRVAGVPPFRQDFANWAERILAYCVFRASDPAFEAPARQSGDALAQATAFNVARELGHACDPAPIARALRAHTCVVNDGRMQPWEWLATADATADDRLWKLDATSHGDDHLLPGPCDPAWELAGVIVEWEPTEAERTLFLERFAAATGDRDVDRVRAYEVAYASFRAACCGMAGHAATGPQEIARWQRERARLQARGRLALARLQPRDFFLAPI